jgi:hypothetical protein
VRLFDSESRFLSVRWLTVVRRYFVSGDSKGSYKPLFRFPTAGTRITPHSKSPLDSLGEQAYRFLDRLRKGGLWTGRWNCCRGRWTC